MRPARIETRAGRTGERLERSDRNEGGVARKSGRRTRGHDEPGRPALRTLARPAHLPHLPHLPHLTFPPLPPFPTYPPFPTLPTYPPFPTHPPLPQSRCPRSESPISTWRPGKYSRQRRDTVTATSGRPLTSFGYHGFIRASMNTGALYDR